MVACMCIHIASAAPKAAYPPHGCDLQGTHSRMLVMVTDLSYLDRGIVNDGIDLELCSLLYTLVGSCGSGSPVVGQLCTNGEAAYQISISPYPGAPLGLVPAGNRVGRSLLC